MVTVAIISEYNPFHLGHEYQIKKIREEFGKDTAIIAIMSGNYVQRGDVAIADKNLRAAAAVMSGVNLVLELPFPYSMSSAEFFAKAGVKIASSLGAIDYLSFGSESGDIKLLTAVAENMMTPEYQKSLKDALEANKATGMGYPELCEHIYKKTFGDGDFSQFFTPNNILAIEYIKALRTARSIILPHTVKRCGAGYSDTKIESGELPSASAIREILSKDDVSAFDYFSISSKSVFSDAYKNNEFPCDGEKLAAAVISKFRLSNPMASTDIHDAGGGLYNRLYDASFEADSISSLTALTETKKYTNARIKRAIWYSFFGVTSSEVKELPSYTQVLALDAVGRRVLKGIKKVCKIPIITKPSARDKLPASARAAKELADRADSVFQMTKPKPISGRFALICSPFVKK